MFVRISVPVLVGCREMYSDHTGSSCDRFQRDAQTPDSFSGMIELIEVASQHLESALQYTLIIPSHERGIRRFCLWALGMAVLSLRRIYSHPAPSETTSVKISRRSVRTTMLVGGALARRDWALTAIFRSLTRKISGDAEYPGRRVRCVQTKIHSRM